MSEPAAWLFGKDHIEQALLPSEVCPEGFLDNPGWYTPLYTGEEIERNRAAIVELVGALRDELDAWTDIHNGGSPYNAAWESIFSQQRMNAIKAVISRYDTTKTKEKA